MAIIEKKSKKTKKNRQVLVRIWRNWNPCTLLVGMKMVQLLEKTI